jgi:hypothetical protein
MRVWRSGSGSGGGLVILYHVFRNGYEEQVHCVS